MFNACEGERVSPRACGHVDAQDKVLVCALHCRDTQPASYILPLHIFRAYKSLTSSQDIHVQHHRKYCIPVTA